MGNYASSIAERLTAAGFQPEMPLQKRKAVAFGEKGKRYSVEVSEGSTMVYAIDGYVIKDGIRCDKLLIALNDQKGMAVFVELKGSDIMHAVEQLEKTINNPLFSPYPMIKDNTRARIVSAGGPKSASRSKFIESQIRFKRDYHIELRQIGSKDSPIKLQS